MSILLFLNGEWSSCISELTLSQFDQVICTDGATANFIQTFQQLPDLILGDGDSLTQAFLENKIDPALKSQLNWIKTPDQDYTDFEKALIYLSKSKAKKITIYGATGKEIDHFIGNIAVAKRFYKRFELIFKDDFSCFFFLPSPFQLKLKTETMFSLIPFSKVTHFELTGALYPPNQMLEFGEQMSLRNQTTDEWLSGSFDSGDLLIVISRSID